MAMVGGQNECIMAVNNDPDRWAPPTSETERGVESGLAGPAWQIGTTRPQGKREKG